MIPFLSNTHIHNIIVDTIFFPIHTTTLDIPYFVVSHLEYPNRYSSKYVNPFDYVDKKSFGVRL